MLVAGENDVWASVEIGRANRRIRVGFNVKLVPEIKEQEAFLRKAYGAQSLYVGIKFILSSMREATHNLLL